MSSRNFAAPARRLSLALAAMPALVPMMVVPLAPAAAQEASYVLGPDDVIDVQVYGQFPQPVRLRIRADGNISLPLLGDVRAAGLTPGDLAAAIRQQYNRGGYYTNPIVNVEVVSYVSRGVTVLGAVKTPGIVPLVRPTTLSAVIAQAGGQTGTSEVAILRRRGGAEQRFVIGQIAGTDADPVLQAGDVIVVPASERFFVYGQVRQPGAYPLEPGMTFRQALAQAGGQNDSGTQNRIQLYRAGAKTDIDELDTPIRSGDVLFIRDRIF